ncbi:hypothetical protein ACCS54_18945 [Rhizobium johnstonii]
MSIGPRASADVYTPMIEPLSLDVAYFDVTENLNGMEIATDIAEEIRARIKAATGLNASAGILTTALAEQDGEWLSKCNSHRVKVGVNHHP